MSLQQITSIKLEDLDSITDVVALRKCRSSRRENLTKVENHLSSIKDLSLGIVNMRDLEAKLFMADESITMYDAVNDRLLDLGESDVSSAEVETTSLRMTSIRVMLQSKIDACYLHQSARSLVMEIKDHLASSVLDTPSVQGYFSALAAKRNDCQRNALSFANETSLIVTMQQLRDKFRDAQKCSREASCMSIPTSVVPASAEVKLSSDYSRSSHLRVDLPTFNGKSTAWYSFWTLFSAIIKEQEISSTEKTCHLIQAMESKKAKTLATQAAGDEMDFDYVMGILRERYERKRVLFAQHLQSMVTKCKTGYNHHDFSALSSYVDIFLSSLHEPSDDEVKVRCYVVDNILPVSACQDIQALWNKPEIRVLSPLADPQLGEAGNVDTLLSITDRGRCYRNVYYQINNQTINIHRTIFGWTVGGAFPSPGTSAVVGRVSCRELTTNELLASFFELEKVSGEDTHQSPDEVAALQHSTDNHNRDSSGRYSVALPRKTPHLELGSSRPATLRRFRANERKLKATEGHWEEFCRGLDEYIEMDHAELVLKEDLEKPDKDCYYLPMHAVRKESSSTTRLRIVFDASAKTSSGHSLNDQLLTGPSLYPKLTSVITQFRQHRIAASIDISKMFREILLHPNERDFLRFLRFSPSSHQIETCRMKRLTFGVSSSPFLATKVLRQAAADHKEEFPKAAEVIIQVSTWMTA